MTIYIVICLQLSLLRIDEHTELNLIEKFE